MPNDHFRKVVIFIEEKIETFVRETIWIVNKLGSTFDTKLCNSIGKKYVLCGITNM